ncbi:LysR substrate-binding domain-containing protein [Pseudoduganella violaceinigra]|uniref:LysR substrate-binding domain-containing protein n=1 Tax=Pseudoduganella violaceinigra TaxID=246602 RepID=UPI00041912DB|nr:LysR substrate-binding domain-containing protein [Pseudoduganella violaceinigra]
MAWLAAAPRIGARSRPDLWPGWARAHGMEARALAPTLELDNTVLAIQAAIQGLGVLVVPEAFVAAMAGHGTLQRIHSASIGTGAYAFAAGRQRASPRVELFTRWLVQRGGP